MRQQKRGFIYEINLATLMEPLPFQDFWKAHVFVYVYTTHDNYLQDSWVSQTSQGFSTIPLLFFWSKKLRKKLPRPLAAAKFYLAWIKKMLLNWEVVRHPTPNGPSPKEGLHFHLKSWGSFCQTIHISYGEPLYRGRFSWSINHSARGLRKEESEVNLKGRVSDI